MNYLLDGRKETVERNKSTLKRSRVRWKEEEVEEEKQASRGQEDREMGGVE